VVKTARSRCFRKNKENYWNL